MATAHGRVLSEGAFASHVPIDVRRKVVANLGWKNVLFPRPVRPGDTVYAESEILGTRESRSRPTQGIVHVRTRALDQRGEEVCSYVEAGY